jgi:hypothetical protein
MNGTILLAAAMALLSVPGCYGQEQPEACQGALPPATISETTGIGELTGHATPEQTEDPTVLLFSGASAPFTLGLRPGYDLAPPPPGCCAVELVRLRDDYVGRLTAPDGLWIQWIDPITPATDAPLVRFGPPVGRCRGGAEGTVVIDRFSAVFSFADEQVEGGEIVSGELDGRLVRGVVTRDFDTGAAVIYRPAD